MSCLDYPLGNLCCSLEKVFNLPIISETYSNSRNSTRHALLLPKVFFVREKRTAKENILKER